MRLYEMTAALFMKFSFVCAVTVGKFSTASEMSYSGHTAHIQVIVNIYHPFSRMLSKTAFSFRFLFV